MPRAFVSEPLLPLEGSFDTALMSRGEPGVPRRFRWRDREWTVAEVLDSRREFGDCSHGSGERYVRKHRYRIRTVEGWVLLVDFKRTFGRGQVTSARTRWRVFSIEEQPEDEGTRKGWPSG
ncbi:phosphoribosylglycinamide formyltransferase-1 [Verrucomicrobium sp. GAS474]|uniref:DUF6504 family protein n=1 Tax=Verrucomicrobium sp. GAS474 TaxID=1882831 RepID=UPI0008796F56|nr:DUF6504 family protein [Verrucomicrobium sp. GAS474]SDU22802.1 phosphoribosylglycinamide formyltransferase-1 [Verrucomicrobium sp. GAS474]